MLRRMMTFAAGLAVLMLLTVAASLFPGRLNANVDRTRLLQTEQKIADTAAASQQVVQQLSAANLADPNVAKEVGKQIKALVHQRSDLEAYQEQLKQECEAFANTRSTKMTEVDREIEAIDDPLLKRQMQRRREQAYRETGAALSAARATVAELAAVLKQASNIQHVANCIRLSEELAANSQDLRVQIQQIRTFASDYSQRTATLLATLSQAGVEPAAPAVAD